jgi:hypothetical protein
VERPVETEPTAKPLSDAERSRRFLPNDPLDVPFPENARPIYYNPHFREGSYRIHAKDTEGNDHPVGRVRFRSHIYVPSTPREEMWAREYVRKLLNGNNPDRWKGDTLDEEDRPVCANASCGFTTLNHKAWQDHMKFTKHQQRI